MRFSIFTVSLVLLFAACKDEKMSRAEADQAANPFNPNQAATQPLSELDKAKLAAAIGKTTVLVDGNDLLQKINNATDKLHVFCFWNLKSRLNAAALAATAQNLDSTKIKINYINIGDPNLDSVHLAIREYSMADDNYRLPSPDLTFLQRVKKEISPNLPLILFVNRSEHLLTFYQQTFDAAEINAVISPLVN
jgi:hypothetical protein